MHTLYVHLFNWQELLQSFDLTMYFKIVFVECNNRRLAAINYVIAKTGDKNVGGEANSR